MSAFCIHLNDDTPLFVPKYQHPHYTERQHINVDPAMINSYWYNKMLEHDLEIHRVELFYGPDDLTYVMGIHTDRSFGDWGKINWVYGGDGYEMHWYKPISSASKDVLATPVHSKYNLFEPSEVHKIHSIKPITPFIVQVGIPHNITNPGHERWCYSMVINDKLTNDNATFGRLKRAFGK